MSARSEFWVHIHDLAEDLQREGDTSGERLANMMASFYALPPLARAEVEKSLTAVHAQLPEVVAAIGLHNKPKT